MAEDGGAYRGPSRLEIILLVVAVAGIAAGALFASGILPLGSNSDEAATVLLTGIYPGATTPPPSPTAAPPPNRCPGQAPSRHQPSRRCPPPPRLHRLGILLSRRPGPHRSPLLLLQQRPCQRSKALPHRQLSSLLCSRLQPCLPDRRLPVWSRQPRRHLLRLPRCRQPRRFLPLLQRRWPFLLTCSGAT